MGNRCDQARPRAASNIEKTQRRTVARLRKEATLHCGRDVWFSSRTDERAVVDQLVEERESCGAAPSQVVVVVVKH